MPLLFSLAIHNALKEAKRETLDGEEFFAFLDDVYILSSPARTRCLYNVVGEKLSNMAGIQLHNGKTHAAVWSLRGVKVQGTPVGSDEFVKEVSDARLEEEHKLWNAIPWIPDLQCAWQVLLQCAGPRCHHFIRTMPPSKSMEYAQGHDRGMLRSMEAILGSLPGIPSQNETAHTLASLPMRMGGLGLRSAVRMAPAAFWASWVDALAMIATRLPQAATSIVHRLTRIAGGSDELELGPSRVRFTTRLGCIAERNTTTSHHKR